MKWLLRGLALVVVALAVIGAGVFLNARLHPVSCPGAFIGCASNGEEVGYLLALGSDALALLAAILAVIQTQRLHAALGWRIAAIVAAALTAILFPLVGGLYAVVLLSIASPDLGLYAYLLIPLVVGIGLLGYSAGGSAQTSPARAPLR
ncbi:MAG TPA: hypothetical protein VIG77_13905 [Ktedonobacterales bacterium]